MEIYLKKPWVFGSLQQRMKVGYQSRYQMLHHMWRINQDAAHFQLPYTFVEDVHR